MARFVGEGGTTQSGRKGAPFLALLVDNVPSYSLDENYSAGAVDAYWQAPADALIYTIGICVDNSAAAQGAGFGGNFFGETILTYGLKFAVKNSAGTIINDITVTQPLLDGAAVSAIFSDSASVYAYDVGTASANNQITFIGAIKCVDSFGAPLRVESGNRFVCTLQDDFSALENMTISVSGQFI